MLYAPSVRRRPGTTALLLLLSLLVSLVAAPAARAQAALEITTVNVFANQPAPNVRVTITNDAIGYTATRTTNARGTVQLAGLATSGRYTVRVTDNDRFYTAEVADVTLRSNVTRSVRLLLNPISEVELDEVVVKGQTSIADVNTVNAEVSSSLSAQALETLPVEGRNVIESLHRLPNVTLATGFYPEAPTVSINGANGLFTNYLVDGMDNNENFLGGPQFEVPTGMVKDVTVLTSTYSAEYGRTGNGIFNVTTKSGDNTWDGEAFYLTRPGPPLDGNSRFAQRDLSGNAVKNGFMRHQGGVSLGGPLQKDRTFLFVNVEHTTDWKDNLLNTLGVNETVQGQNHFTYASAKLDHRWTDRWRSSLRANANRVRIDRQGGGLTGGVQFASAANTQHRDGVHTALQTTYAGDRVVYEANVQYSRFNWNYADAATPNAPQVAIQDPTETTVGVIGHPGFTFDSVEHTLQLQQKVTYSLGRHTLKAGADVVASDVALAGGGNPNGNYTVRLTEGQLSQLQRRDLSTDLAPSDLQSLDGPINVLNYGVELRPATFGTRQDQVGLYLEDQFAPLPDLNVTAGLRWDYDSLSKGGAASGDWTNLAPRLSLNYALGTRSSLRAGYGMFYDKIVYSVYSDALQQNTTAAGYRGQLQALIDQGILPSDTDLDRVTFDGNLTANASDVPYLDGPTPQELQSARGTIISNELRILNPNGYDNPLTHQFSAGYQRQLDADKLFYVDLVHTRSFNLFRLRDLNAPAPGDPSAADLAAAQADPDRDPSDIVRTPAEADATRPVAPVDGGARRIVMTETAGEARYWAANVNLVKERGADAFAYRLSYTLSRLRNNTDDINFRAEDANDFADEWGPSVNDRTHVFSGVWSYVPLSNLTATVATLLQSGQPVNRVPDASVFGTRDLNGDGRSFGDAYTGNSDRHPGEGRNSDRLPWSVTVDVGLQYAVPLTGGRVVARADVFNVFNAANFSGYANNATQSNQIQIGPAGSGRLIQKNASPPRQFQFGVRYLF